MVRRVATSGLNRRFMIANEEENAEVAESESRSDVADDCDSDTNAAPAVVLRAPPVAVNGGDVVDASVELFQSDWCEDFDMFLCIPEYQAPLTD